MKIDIYTHIFPKKFMDAFSKRVGDPAILQGNPRPFQPERSNIELRIDVINRFPGLVQVLTPTGHTLETFASPDDAVYLAKIYNDEMAELVFKYADKFIAAVACLPLNNIDATLKEIDRTINELGFKGILLNTPVNGKPLDSPEFIPIYECMSKYMLPIWIHPTRRASIPDYASEKTSKYATYLAFGWPYETSLAMIRLVCSGIIGKYPNLKFITHHAGAMIPFLSSRINSLDCPYDQVDVDKKAILQSKTPTEYFQMFYTDTAISGNTPGLMCAQAFFGTEHLLFGTDMPFGRNMGENFVRQTIEAIEAMGISESDKRQIFEGNAKTLLNLS